MAPLQEIVDVLAARAGRAIDVEDRRFHLLAHSAHDGPVDEVRRDTILRRVASPRVVARLDGLGLDAAREPVRLPPAPALGMGARVCFPVRERDRLLGFVWVVDDPPLDDAGVAALAAGLAPVGPALAVLRDAEDLRRAEEQSALVALLEGEPRRAVGLLGSASVHVAVAPIGSDLTPLRRAAGAGRVLTGEHAGRAVAVLVGEGFAVAGPDATGPVPLGVGSVAPTLEDAPRSHREAVLALRVAEAVPRLGPVARWDELGPYALLAPLAFPPAGGVPAEPPAALRALASASDGPELLATLQVVLDAGEDVAGAAAALHVHRSTLHRRLRRVEQLTGRDLATGADRLELHAGLLLSELLGTEARR